MLNAVFLIFIPPLFFGFLWNSTWIAQSANHALEQVQLDAVSLSLCHQNKEFLETAVRKTNQKIRAIQNSLSVTGASCLAEFAIASASFTPVLAAADLQVCVSTRMRPLEVSAFLIEQSQMLASQEFSAYRRREFKILLRKNHLNEKYVRGAWFLPPEAGLRRAPLSLEHQSIAYELSLLGHSVHWPKFLVSKPLSFTRSFSARFRYEPGQARGLRKSESYCELQPLDPWGEDKIKWHANAF